jgi:hypothetical protein
MRKTALISSIQGVRCVVAAAGFMTLAATSGHAAEESKSDTIGPWEIEAVYRGDKFDRCAISRPLEDDIVVRFVRTSDGLSLELSSPNWELDRGKNYPVKMAMGPLSFDTEVAAEPNAVSMDIEDEKFESGLRAVSALNVVAAGATIRVPLDKSMVAFDRLKQCVQKNNTSAKTNPFEAPSRAP